MQVTIERLKVKLKRPTACLTMFTACTLGLSKPLAAQLRDPKFENTMEPFSLPVWSENREFNLSEQEEGILVLDFFAYWCIPCLQTSLDLEQNINRYFESREGNAHGLSVRVLSINVEANGSEKTEAFIKKAGIRLALNDPGGKVLELAGGKALPHIVILKGDQSPGGTRWEIVYKNSGYQGTEIIRSVIDSIEPSQPEEQVVVVKESTELPIEIIEAPSVAKIAQFQVNEDLAPGTVIVIKNDETQPPVQEKEFVPPPAYKGIEYSAGSEILLSSDVFLFSSSLQRTRTLNFSDWDMLFIYGHIDIDYEPVPEADVIGRSTKLAEPNASAQFTYRISKTTNFEYQLSGGGYTGFTDHRSLWLDEYYRQQFSGLDGYIDANPQGINVSGGVQWDTTSTLGVLGATIVFQKDDVAPGYDRPLFQPLVRGREQLDTSSLLLEQESVISKTARMRHQLQLTKTTDRELRYRYSGSVNYAPGENWVLRAEGAATHESVEQEEESDFRAYSVGIILEHDWDQQWFVGITGRRYKDNGKIETSILVSSGPPALETTHAGVTLRHQGENSSWKLSLAAYRSRFDEIDSPIRPFGNLYKDRNWLLAEVSYNHLF
ncbi:MAG: TlpA disulfide reductase family protein [Verrucomicrobia bacterium]|nr:TlpA disulfide reductase family protein [Verrucomicrobiota bacterium]